MKSLLFLLGALLFAGCATTEPVSPPAPPSPRTNSIHDAVLQADEDWADYLAIGQVSEADEAAARKVRDAYDDALVNAAKAGTNYIAKVTELMMPSLGVPRRQRTSP